MAPIGHEGEILDKLPTDSNSVYNIVTTRIKEYLGNYKSAQSLTTRSNDQHNKTNNIGWDVACITAVSLSVLFTGVASISIFKIGVLNTLLICIFVLTLLVFGYVNFVTKESTQFVEFFDDGVEF